MIYEVIDYWRNGNIYYSIYIKEGRLFFSEAEIPKDLQDLEDNA